MSTKKKMSADELQLLSRAAANEFLQRPNVTSVGIGYREKDGKPTSEMVIQVSVSKKVKPDILESLGTTMLPESFKIGNLELPTDVVERVYKPSYILVESEKIKRNPRHMVMNPMQPGVSIANFRETAGTLGQLCMITKPPSPCY